ncbi:MAG: hypothetical protein ACLU9Y_16480 [Thomasclavelia ramosa]
MSNRKVNPDSLRQVTRYINEYSQHIWDNELTGDKEFVRVKENNKLKTVRSRSKDGKYYYPYASYEGGAKTIGPGFKLNDTSDFTKSVKAKGKATRKQIDAELNRRMAKAYNDVRDIYSEKYGIDDFNTLPQPIVNLMSNLAYRVGRTGFRQYKKLLKGANERNTDSIIKEYTTGNKRRDKSELEIFKTNSSNDYDMIRNKLFSNFNTDDNPDNYVEDMSKTNRKKYNFGGIRSTHDATADYLGMARNSGNSFFGNGMIDLLYHGGKNDDTGIPVKNYVDKLITNDKLIYANMQNKINNEVLTSRGITAKFGGLVGTPRRKFYWGGTSINDPGSVQWGTRVQTSDIDESKYSADGEGIVGGSALSGAGTGLGIGAAVGGTAALATGAAAGSWLGPIGAGIGALIGGIVGLFTGRKKKRQEERRRQELLAEQAEMERQQTLGNMQDKVENDVATIRQSNLGNYSEGTGFYAKLGGMVGRRKLNTGGQVVPNSSNSVVAYGQTHEQYNPATGETGIIYGDSEIEGGGAKNGRMYAGEVVRETSEGGQVFSDTIKVPGTNRTFADYAKKLTDMKGKKEAQVIQLADGVTLSLSALDKSKTNKLQTGTNVRNIEKLVYRMNKARGESEAIDAKTEDLFEAQELYATALGLRNDAPVMRCGGMVRKKRPFGGYASPYSLTGVSAPKLTTLPPIQTTASAGGGSAFKFGFNEFGLGMNLASSLFGIVGNALNTRANRKAIEFESTLHVPKGNKVDAVQYSTDYDISEELQELGTQERRAARYITDNTSNVQTARNSVANLAINAQLARNKLYGAKKDYQRQRYDLNRQERVNARNANSQIMYQDAINEYNKAVGLNQQLMSVRTQGLQGMLQGVEGLAGAVNNYASARLYEKLWPRGVTNHMRSGFACGGLARRKRA